MIISATLPQNLNIGTKYTSIYGNIIPADRIGYRCPVESPMISCTFISRSSRHSFNMRLPERLYRRASISDDGSLPDSHELPRFSFEGDHRPLVSTERLFNHWSADEETVYNPGFNTMKSALELEQDIIVSRGARAYVHNADAHCRSLGMGRTTLRIRSTGHNRVNGSSQCLVSTSYAVSADQWADCVGSVHVHLHQPLLINDDCTGAANYCR
jgi:hypothetical protein